MADLTEDRLRKLSVDAIGSGEGRSTMEAFAAGTMDSAAGGAFTVYSGRT
jgi:hypothetical protein